MRFMWEHFEHGADIGVRGYGDTMPAAFEQAALAMTAVVSDPASIEPHDEVEIECDAPDQELLLVDWLNAIIYEMATRRMLFSRFDVRVELAKAIAVEPVQLDRKVGAVEENDSSLFSRPLARPG